MKEDDDNRSVLICNLVAECEPYVEAYVDACDQCGRAIWRAFSSPQTDLDWCGECALVEIKNAKEKRHKIEFEKLSKEQEEEIRWWRTNFGYR